MKLRTVLIAAIIIIAGCKKKDTTAPGIYLLGANPAYVDLNSSYSDAGASATDDTDGNITSNIITTYWPSTGVNVNVVGNYNVVYNVSDAAGNPATQVSRTVIVHNAANNFIGKYNEAISYGSTLVYATDSVFTSNTVNNEITFTKFGLDTTASINADININTITIPTQTVGSHTYYGSGIINNNAFLITFRDSTASLVKPCTVNFTKQ